MTFDIRITFDGLFLLGVHQNNNAVHALLMNFGEDTPCCDGSHDMSMPMPANALADQPKHFPMLFFDAAHTGVDSDFGLTGHLYGVSMKNRVVRLGGNDPTNFATFDKAIVNISALSTAGKLASAHCGPKPVRAVAGRVTLTAGNPQAAARATIYDVDPPPPTGSTPVRIARQIEWLIKDFDDPNGNDSLQLEFLDLEDETVVQKSEVLVPVEVTRRLPSGKLESRPLVRLHVYCVPAHELPGGSKTPPAKIGDVVPHVGGLFQLLPHVTVPKLTINKVEQTGSTEECIGLRADVG